mgnify:CR=1 FL=1
MLLRRQTLGRRGAVLFAAALLLALACGTARAFIREGGIAGRPGLSFHGMACFWGHLDVNITNGTRKNVIFGGTMLFLDRYGRTVARAELLPAKVKRQAFRRYKGQFVQGSGEEASKADRLMWLFDLRNE